MNILLYLLLGAAIGTLSGALGIGGGVLLIPLLMWLCDFDFPRAAGTSLAALAPPVTLPGALRAYSAGRVDVEAAICLAVAFSVGGYFGAGLVNTKYLPAETLRFGFGLLLLVVAVRFLLSTDSHAAAAAAGLVAAAVAWLAFLGLRALGRRYPRPDLAQLIRRQAEKGRGEGDYQI